MPKTYTLTGITGTGESVALPVRILHTDKFKAGMLSLSCALPLQRKDSWMLALLLAVLRRGSEKYPSLAAVNQRLDELFST